VEDPEAKDSPEFKKDRSTCERVVSAGKIKKISYWDAWKRKINNLGRSDVVLFYLW